MADKPKTLSDHIFDWGPWVFNALLVVIGILAVFVARRQADIMDRQARLMDRQEKLMRVPYKQWVALDNWKADYDPGPSPPTTNRLRIRVDVLNQTDFPLTLTQGSMKFKFIGGVGYARYEIGEQSFLPPKIPHTIDTWVFISEAHVGVFMNSVSVMPMEGVFSHFGQLGEQSLLTQRFAGLLECGKNVEPRFIYEIHMNPEVQQPDEDEKRNPNQETTEG